LKETGKADKSRIKNRENIRKSNGKKKKSRTQIRKRKGEGRKWIEGHKELE